MDEFQLLIDLHKGTPRQGPGGFDETKRALDLSMIDLSSQIKVADIGCGTGASTLDLARLLNASITAVDLMPAFVEELKVNAKREGVAEKVEAVVGSMEDLQFRENEYDLIWSEGAIYNMGFKKGIKEWKRFIKPGGVLAVSEITWITKNQPVKLGEYWKSEYPEIDTASSKIGALEENGYSLLGYFVLPEHCWFENYYAPLEAGFTAFLERNAGNENAKAVLESTKHEIALYKKYSDYFSYGVYVAKKCI